MQDGTEQKGPSQSEAGGWYKMGRGRKVLSLEKSCVDITPGFGEDLVPHVGWHHEDKADQEGSRETMRLWRSRTGALTKLARSSSTSAFFCYINNTVPSPCKSL